MNGALLCALLGPCLTACSQTSAKIDYGVISIDRAKEVIKTGDVIILDVRKPNEFRAGKIDGAINIDYFAPDFRDQLGALDKSASYLVYCKKGGRSAKATTIMKELGFEKVYDMSGGYDQWDQKR